ncbi:MAG: protein-L-isoaspartate(D-aspartate) O-methyltransferase [Pirellulaceae bacterium]|jgi:protein-L-isoaspartate(D-aspartate) O-methyltransferase|nr:protein-L-isoaspartate(D-aspartate) O-methyltransferase [Pirellulaceae bacterium]MDP7016680.1 protein-L-isoaspartate(D-aspartate) O-methyltransferase [Pirellulaceae bacterium]
MSRLVRRFGLVCLLQVICFLAGRGVACGQAKDLYRSAREQMVRVAIESAGVENPRVLDAMRNTLRHEFVAAAHRPRAYFDMALPIGNRQTISSPFIVAYMTESLDPQPDDKVLEIGTGSGYQAAVLSPIVKDVYTIEIVPELGQRAKRTLRRLRYRNVHAKVGDGFQGWPEHAPFDKIIVTCSPEKPPLPLIQQLREGGLMVIPVGERYQQTLYMFRKQNGRLEAEPLRPTLFVPMTGRAEENRLVKPNPKRPTCLNGDFEEKVPKNGFVPGWYYQRQMTVETEAAPVGKAYIRFENKDDGRAAHLMQGFPVDGKSIEALRISAHYRHDNVQDASHGGIGALAVTFYDANRKELSNRVVARFRGDSEWTEVTRSVPVPAGAREGIIRVGLFGATGVLAVDDIRMQLPQ